VLIEPVREIREIAEVEQILAKLLQPLNRQCANPRLHLSGELAKAACDKESHASQIKRSSSDCEQRMQLTQA